MKVRSYRSPVGREVYVSARWWRLGITFMRTRKTEKGASVTQSRARKTDGLTPGSDEPMRPSSGPSPSRPPRPKDIGRMPNRPPAPDGATCDGCAARQDGCVYVDDATLCPECAAEPYPTITTDQAMYYALIAERDRYKEDYHRLEDAVHGALTAMKSVQDVGGPTEREAWQRVGELLGPFRRYQAGVNTPTGNGGDA